MAFGIYMTDINSALRPPCTQFVIAKDWETLIQSKDKPTPYLIMWLGIIFMTLLFVIAIKICHQRITIVMPLHQPRDLANLFLPFFIILALIGHIINQ